MFNSLIGILNILVYNFLILTYLFSFESDNLFLLCFHLFDMLVVFLLMLGNLVVFSLITFHLLVARGCMPKRVGSKTN